MSGPQETRQATGEAIRQQQLGCPVDGCTWRSDPFPALAPGQPRPAAAVGAWVLHVYWAHPEWRALIRRQVGHIADTTGWGG